MLHFIITMCLRVQLSDEVLKHNSKKHSIYLFFFPDKWTHIAGTYDSATGKSKIYVNGELRNMTIGGGLLSRDWLARAGIGDHKAGRPLMGFIDEFRIYNYALTKAEIETLAKMCLPGGTLLSD